MTEYFARIENNLVQEVIVADSDFIKYLSGNWIETFPDGLLRYNYAGIGFCYDAEKDAFYPPQPYPSWQLDYKFQWQSPLPYPTDGKFYLWNEENKLWQLAI